MKDANHVVWDEHDVDAGQIGSRRRMISTWIRSCSCCKGVEVDTFFLSDRSGKLISRRAGRVLKSDFLKSGSAAFLGLIVATSQLGCVQTTGAPERVTVPQEGVEIPPVTGVPSPKPSPSVSPVPSPKPSASVSPVPSPSGNPSPFIHSKYPFGGEGFGLPVEGEGFANTRYSEMHSYRFMAEHTGYIRAARAWLKTNLRTKYEIASDPLSETVGYSTGAGGRVRFEIRADDGSSNHFPSTTVLGVTSEVTRPRLDVVWTSESRFRRLEFKSPVYVEKGKIYHLISRQLNPSDGTISVNDMFSRQGGPAVSPHRPTSLTASIRYSGGKWDVREGRNPIFEVIYRDESNPSADGVVKGSALFDGYTGSRRTFIDHARQARLVVKVPTSRVINTVYAALRRLSSQNGEVSMKLRRADGSLIRSVSVPADRVYYLCENGSCDRSLCLDGICTGEWDPRPNTAQWVRFNLGSDVKIEANTEYSVEFSGSTSTVYSLTGHSKATIFGFSEDKAEAGISAQYRLTPVDSWSYIPHQSSGIPSHSITFPVFGIRESGQ